ncbi:MAG: RagB/SusD family nutrient uptake outer membrane protein [Odoribacteraceae bacterium]|jgi:hypothetical protein|nr:RagB/SusD family nutrient uptake outer membrane protein [Odoribacteraceae bacterium]
MKKYRFTSILFLASLAWGCGKFLEEYSLNELRPGSVIDLQQLMIGEAYPVTGFFAPYLEFMTDDITSNISTRAGQPQLLLKGEGPFMWRHDMYETMEERGVINANSYELYYKHVKACNVVLDHLDGVVGSTDEKNKARGEALALRAYYYFMLVNLYGQPYNAPGVDVNTAPGVPLLVSSAVKDENPSRASVGAVYRQIEADLLEAEGLLAELGRGNSKWRVTDLFVYNLLSRVYLYEERWQEAAEYATKVLHRSPLLVDLCKLTNASGTFATTNSFPSNAFAIAGVETIWVFSSYLEYSFSLNATTFPTYSNASPAPYTASASLLASYDYSDVSATDRKDLRPHFFYIGYGAMSNRHHVLGQKTAIDGNADLPTKGMRVAEAYLNRAEALARLFAASGDAGNRVGALADLNYLREHRYDRRNAAYVPVDIADAAELLQFCLDERRRELAYEEHRWFDLRRNGMPGVVHSFRTDAEQVVVKDSLVVGDRRYVLPIPAKALEKNPNLTPNPSNTPV